MGKHRDRETLRLLFKKQNGRCFYCETPTYLPRNGETKVAARERLGITPGVPGSGIAFGRLYATREHLKRQADGGTNGRHNQVMACAGCNHARGEHSVQEWLEHKRPKIPLNRRQVMEAAE